MPPTNRSVERMPHGRDNPLEVDWLLRSAQGRLEDFRRWLEKHHLSSRELWVGFYKKSTGRPCLTWPESVDEALCFGRIDGLRKRVDEASCAIRFSPRRTGSIWSSVNIRRTQELIRQVRMTPAGQRRSVGLLPGAAALVSTDRGLVDRECEERGNETSTSRLSPPRSS